MVALAQSTFAQVTVASANVRRLNHCPPIDAPGGRMGMCGWIFTDSPFRGMYLAGPPGHGTGFDFNSGVVLLNTNGTLIYTGQGIWQKYIVGGSELRPSSASSMPMSMVYLIPTQVRTLELALWSQLKLDQLIRRRYGNGRRTIVVAAGFDCPACKTMEMSLSALRNRINATIYIIPDTLMPNDPVRRAMVRSIWCAADPAKAWEQAVLRNRLPSTHIASCSPVDDNWAPILENVMQDALAGGTEAFPTILTDQGRYTTSFADIQPDLISDSTGPSQNIFTTSLSLDLDNYPNGN